MSILENLSEEEMDALLDEDDFFIDDEAPGNGYSAPVRNPSPPPVFYMKVGDQMNECDAHHSYPFQQQCSHYCKASAENRCMHLRWDKYCTY